MIKVTPHETLFICIRLLELEMKVREDFPIIEKAPTYKGLCWLKAPTSSFTFKTLQLARTRTALSVFFCELLSLSCINFRNLCTHHYWRS